MVLKVLWRIEVGVESLINLCEEGLYVSVGSTEAHLRLEGALGYTYRSEPF